MQTLKFKLLNGHTIADVEVILRIHNNVIFAPAASSGAFYVTVIDGSEHSCAAMVDAMSRIARHLGTVKGLAPKSTENSGLSVDYYQCPIDFPTTPGREPYTAECNDLIEALGMTPSEANIFKELWRNAAARTLGKHKEGNSEQRAYEKIYFFAKRQLERLTKTRMDQ